VFVCVAYARAGRAVFRTTSIAKKFVDTAENRSKQVCLRFLKGTHILYAILKVLEMIKKIITCRRYGLGPYNPRFHVVEASFAFLKSKHLCVT